MTTEHPAFERLSRLADGDLAFDDAAQVEGHVASCGACRAALTRLRELLAHAAALSSSVDPPPAVWDAIRASVERRGSVRTRRGSWVREWSMRAAAALLLVTGSSAVTTLVLRSRAPNPAPAVTSRSGHAPIGLPASLAVVDQSYAGVVDELTATLELQRPALAPETIAIIDRTLRVIDDAIAEARSALSADPANNALLDVLSANYEHKVQLLRRASELPART